MGITLWLLGMSDPLLWGVLTFCFEFIPFLGGALMVAMLTIVAFTRFEALGHVLAVPGSYLTISTIQNNVASPLVYGRRLRLNPVAVLVGVLFWWSLWGVPGAFLAVPIIATAKVIGDRVPRLRGLGETRSCGSLGIAALSRSRKPTATSSIRACGGRWRST